MVAEYDLAERLTETEQNILRMAARNKSAQGIASLYGFPNARAAQQAVDRIVAKLQGTSAPAGNVNGAGAARKPSTGDSSQARRPPESSPRGSRPPAKDRILAYLREHGETRQGDICSATGIKRGSIGDALLALERDGMISVRLDGRAKFLSLANCGASRSVSSDEGPKGEADTDDWIDQFVNRQALADEITRLRELIETAQPRLDKLENLQAVLGGVGVL
jgi:DNA-binding transcriptional ArsR family regulator